MGFSKKKYWSVVPFPPPGDLPNPGVEPVSPALQVDSLLSEPPQKPSLAPVLTSWIRTVQSGRDQWVCVIRSLAGDAHQAWMGWTLHSGVWDPQRAHYLHEIWRQPATSILRGSAALCPRKLDHQEESRMPWGSEALKEGERYLHCKWRVQNRRFAHLHHAWGSRAQKV